MSCRIFLGIGFLSLKSISILRMLCVSELIDLVPSPEPPIVIYPPTGDYTESSQLIYPLYLLSKTTASPSSIPLPPPTPPTPPDAFQ